MKMIGSRNQRGSYTSVESAVHLNKLSKEM